MTEVRTSSKVRRWANRTGLGGIRHVESSRPPARYWALWAVIYAPLFAYFWIDRESIVLFGATVAAFLLIFVIVTVYLGGEKLVVLDRGVIIGSFAPLAKPYVVPFSSVDARTVRTWTATMRPFNAMVLDGGMMSTHRTTVWSRRQVSFVGLGWRQCRALLHHRPIDMADPLATEVWVFTTNSPRRQQRTAWALSAALREAGAFGVETSEAFLGNTPRLQVSVRDADFLCIPPFWRRQPYRAPGRPAVPPGQLPSHRT